MENITPEQNAQTAHHQRENHRRHKCEYKLEMCGNCHDRHPRLRGEIRFECGHHHGHGEGCGGHDRKPHHRPCKGFIVRRPPFWGGW